MEHDDGYNRRHAPWSNDSEWVDVLQRFALSAAVRRPSEQSPTSLLAVQRDRDSGRPLAQIMIGQQAQFKNKYKALCNE